MAQFHGVLKHTELTKKWFMLTADLSFSFTLGEVLAGFDKDLRLLLNTTGLSHDDIIYVTAPSGFITDLASIPASLHWAFKPNGSYAAAAALHDIIYQTIKSSFPVSGVVTKIDLLNVEHTQLLADRIFLFAMKELKVSYFYRVMFYKAVRAFGKSSYGINPMPEDYGIDSLYRSSPRIEPYIVYRSSLTVGVDWGVTAMKSDDYRFHAVKFPNLKRAFVYATL